MKHFYTFLVVLLVSTLGFGQITEDFDSGLTTSYFTGARTLDSGDWTMQAVIQESSTNSLSGFAARINDDISGAHLTTPALNGAGTISFWYRELNSGGGTFEIQTSTDGSTYTTIDTQLFSGTSFTQYTFNINDSSSNLTIRILNDDQSGHLIIDDLEVTALATGPTITLSETSITGLDYSGSGPSAEQSFTAEGSNLIDDIVITAPTNFEISTTSGSGFGSSITLTESGGNVASTTIFVRLAASLTINTYTGTLSATSNTATQQDISLSGEVTAPSYCDVTGDTTFATSITEVTFAGTTNTSSLGGADDPSGYIEFTSPTFSVDQESTYDLSVNLNTDGDFIIHAVAWIDWNQDFIFDIATEQYDLGDASNTGNGPTTLSPLNITVPVGATLGDTRMRIASRYGSDPSGPCDGSDDGEIEDYTITVNPPNTDTVVEFAIASATVNEGDGSYNIELSITNEDATNPTSVEVALTGGTGDATDIDNYVTQTVTFPAGSAADQTVTITITDDIDIEPNEILIFTLQNISGGSNAIIGLQDTFTLTIDNNDIAPPITLPYSEDFSDCLSVEWTPFDQLGDDTWSCGSGEYLMNGFNGSDDIDWLISNFTVDFSAYALPTIDVTTQERFGNSLNEPGEFELLYSLDYSGSGDPTTATWTSLTYDPNNTSSNSTLSNPSETSVDASSISGIAYLAFRYDMTVSSGAEEWIIQNIEIYNDTTCGLDIANLSPVTCNDNCTVTDPSDDYLTFDLNPSGVNLGSTYNITVSSGTVTPTSAIYGSVTTFTLQDGSAGSGDVTLTITDGSDNGCTLEVIITDPGSCAVTAGCSSIFSDDFSIDLSQWSNNSNWEISSGEMQHNGSGESTDYNYADLGTQDLTTGNYEWEFCMRNGSWDPSGNNKFAYFLISDAINLANTPNGYAVGVNQNDTSDLLTLYEVSNGVYTSIITTSFNWDNSDDVCLRVTRSSTGDWQLFYDENGNGEVSGGTVNDITNTTGNYTGLTFSFTSSRAGLFWVDDINICVDGGSSGITYTFDGTNWLPSSPVGVSTTSDDVVIESGEFTLATGEVIDAAGIVVNPGASLIVDTGATLNASCSLRLESTSSSYSSLIRNGTINGTIHYERFVNQISSGSPGNDLVSIPLTQFDLNFQTFLDFGTPTNRDVLATNPSNTVHAFGPYDNTNLAYVNYPTYPSTLPPDPAAEPLISGKGYRAASTSGANITFTGGALSTDVTIDIDTPTAIVNSQWNLIGNPYPSYLDAGLFLSTNSGPMEDAAEAIYAYNADTYSGNATRTGNFTIINTATILMFTGENFNIAPGQGFFVPSEVAEGSTGTISFTTDPASGVNEMRTTSGADDYIVGRNSSPAYAFKLGMTTTNEVSTTFFFMDNASRGLNPGYDAATFGSNNLYSHLVEENTGRSMALQALALEDMSDVTIPLGVHANQGVQITFGISYTTLPNDIDVYLEDTVTNTVTLLNDSDYILTPNTNLSGTGRFFLRFSNTTLSNPEASLDNINVFANQNNKTIVITGQLTDNTKVMIYDLQGRLVNQTLLNTSKQNQSIDVAHLSSGVYVVQLENASQAKTKKVILK